MAGYRTLGRLLWVGLVAGAAIGAAVGLLVSGSELYWMLGLFGGTTFGMVCGAVTTGASFVVLLAARRAQPSLSPRAARAAHLVLGAVPVAATCGLTWWVASSPDGSLARAVAVTGVALVIATAAVKVAAPWCLAPLAGRQDTTRQ